MDQYSSVVGRIAINFKGSNRIFVKPYCFSMTCSRFPHVLKHQFGVGNRCFTAEIESNHHSYVEESNNLQFRASLDLKKSDWLSHEVLIQISLPRRKEYALQQNWTAFLLSTAFKHSSKLKPSLFYQNKHALTNYTASDSIASYFA